jgi:NosR/NirI family transcriptional regulator, nitrous oxide reductase regulator
MFEAMTLTPTSYPHVSAKQFCWRAWLLAAVGLAALLLGLCAQAATLTRTQLQAEFGDSYQVGERLTALPVWPVYHRGQTAAGYNALHAYVFETIDIEPVAGYGGKPINILVVMNPAGKYLDVRLLSHNEPIFQEKSRNQLLADFALQYKDLTMTHQIQVLTPKAKREFDDQKATLHGVTAGTVSAMAMDRTIMEAAAQVAFARLGDAASGKDDTAKSRNAAAAVSRGADDQFERMGFNELIGARLVQSVSRYNREVQERFNGTEAQGQDAEARLQPNAWALDMMVMLPGLPHVGRNVLDTAGWREVRALREAGHGLVGILDGSRYPLVGSDDAPAGRAARLVLVQNGKRFAVKAVPYTQGLRVSGQRSGVGSHAVMRLFATEANAGLDLAQPMTLEFNLSRGAAAPGQPRLEKEWTHTLSILDAAKWKPVRETPGWVKIWEQRQVDLVILVLGLLVLTAILLAQKWVAAVSNRLTAWRVAYLLFTLVFVGWAAQGQLTIVNLTALTGALMEGQSPAFMLNDPMAIVLWAFVGISLVVWGRGTFCGWLCPFGALQELIAMAAKVLRIKPQQFHRKVDAALKWVKYGVLAALTVSVAVASPLTNTLVEIEPFKTSISMGFQREWPFVVWALACLALSAVVFRGYCRYICPLGAALAILGKLRMLKWIPRRAECGSPCQTCRHGCAYQAIAPTGKVDYDECFQCLDCVSDYQDDQRCLPLIRERKARTIPIKVAPQHA